MAAEILVGIRLDCTAPEWRSRGGENENTTSVVDAARRRRRAARIVMIEIVGREYLEVEMMM